MRIQPIICPFPIAYSGAQAPTSTRFAPPERERLTYRSRKLGLVPILVEGDLDATGFQSSLRFARDAGVTHALVASPPLHNKKRSWKKGKFEFGLAAIADLAPLAPLGHGHRLNGSRAGLDERALVVLDASTLVMPDEETIWDPWRSGEARWRCHEDLTSFEASPRLWEIFGHRLSDDDGHPLDFLDIDYTTVGGPNQRIWGPLNGFKVRYPFSACFQIEGGFGCDHRWVLSIIFKVGSWYLGVVEDITGWLAELEQKVRFELPEARSRRVVGGPRHIRPAVFLRLV